jgi:N-acetylglucosaminyl-diphospho-decaprenol L-rhamnosyltransferase
MEPGAVEREGVASMHGWHDGVALDVVIVSYRCEGMLRDCLGSLRQHPPRVPMEVHVVDNASHDGTAEMVEREFGEVTLRVNATNLGFAAANNLVIRDTRSPYVLVLNPDTRLTEGALDRLLELMQARPEVGMCGPRLELEDGSLDHASKRSFPTPLSAIGHLTGVGRRRGSGALAAYRAPEVESGPVDAVNGAFMLIRGAALDQVGLFDEGFWMYMEDLDLSYRFAEAGWTSWYEPAATVIHVKAGTTGAERTLRLRAAFHYGMYRFYRKHYAPHRNSAVNAAVYLGIAVAMSASVLRAAIRRAARRLGGG